MQETDCTKELRVEVVRLVKKVLCPLSIPTKHKNKEVKQVFIYMSLKLKIKIKMVMYVYAFGTTEYLLKMCDFQRSFQ